MYLSLKMPQTMGKDGFGADFQFALFDGPEEYQYGLVNVAAFLAMANAEGLHEDTCDELNWQQVAGETLGGRAPGMGACPPLGRTPYPHDACAHLPRRSLRNEASNS